MYLNTQNYLKIIPKHQIYLTGHSLGEGTARCGEQHIVPRCGEDQRSLRRVMNSSTGRMPKSTKTHLIS